MLILSVCSLNCDVRFRMSSCCARSLPHGEIAGDHSKEQSHLARVDMIVPGFPDARRGFPLLHNVLTEHQG